MRHEPASPNPFLAFGLLLGIAVAFSFFLGRKVEAASDADRDAKFAFVHGEDVFVYDLACDTVRKLCKMPESDWHTGVKALDDHTILLSQGGKPLDSVFDAATGRNLDRSEVDQYVFNGVVSSRSQIQFTYYAVTYTAVDVNTGTQWRHKLVEHRHFANGEVLHTRTSIFARDGRRLSYRDSVTDCYGKAQMDWVNYCNPLDRFESYTAQHHGRRIHCMDGNLKQMQAGAESLLLPNPEPHFNMKNGNGYVAASLHPSGRHVAYMQLVGDFDYLKGGCTNWFVSKGVFEMDLDLRSVQTVLAEDGYYPAYSPGGRYILLGRSTEECIDYTPQLCIGLFDRVTWTLRDIAIGNRFFWVHHFPGTPYFGE